MAKNDWMVALGAALGGGLEGYNKERDRQREGEKLKELVRKSRFDEAQKGFTRNESGEIVPDVDFYTEGTPAYSRMRQMAEFERMAKGQPAEQTHYDISQFAENPTVKGMGYTRDQLMRIPKGHPILKITEDLYKPRSILDAPMTPEQQAEFARITNIDPKAAAGVPLKHFAPSVTGIRGRVLGAESAQAMADRSDARAAAGREQRRAQHGENLDLAQEKAVMDPVAEMNEKLAELGRLGAHVEAAGKYNPSWSDYQSTRAKFGTQGILGGYTPGVMKPTPKDEERYSFYQGLGQDYVRGLFASGGKALTATEQRLAGSLAINPGDTKEQIRNKGKAIKDYMESKLGSQLESIQRVNPRAAADLRAKYDQVMVDLEQRLMNASQKRARGATSGDSMKAPDSEREASAARLGLNNPAILKAIDDPKNKSKNEAGQKAHAKVAPRLYGKKPSTNKPKTVVQGGHTYTLNEETGEYE